MCPREFGEKLYVQSAISGVCRRARALARITVSVFRLLYSPSPPPPLHGFFPFFADTSRAAPTLALARATHHRLEFTAKLLNDV